jgi:hypothetical protein
MYPQQTIPTILIPMPSIHIIIDISSESDNYQDSIQEAMKGIIAGNRS